MSIVQKAVRGLPNNIRFRMLKFLYLIRNKRMLGRMLTFQGEKFFIYEVDNVFVPSESIGWFVDYDYYLNWVNNLSAWAYKPKEGDIILDIGSGMGEEVLVFSKMTGPSGKVFAIEANPEVFAVLIKIVELNGLSNVQAENIAIANENGDIELNVAQSSFLGGSIGHSGQKTNSFDIKAVRMDSFILANDIARIDLLKTNIEGAERFVIESIGSEIRKVRNVAISCHDFRYREERNEFFLTKKLVKEYLQDNGFAISTQNSNFNHFNDWVYGVNSKWD